MLTLPAALILLTRLWGDGGGTEPTFRVTTDSSRHELRIEYRVEALGDGHSGHQHGGAGHGGHVQRLVRFPSPITGWLRGARVELESPDGARASQHALHHINLLNLSRRQLVHAGIERMWAAGPETGHTVLPAGVGVPVDESMTLGMVVAFDPAELVPGSMVRLRISWTPSTVTPKPVEIYPFPLDVNYRVAQTAAFDLPPGKSSHAFEFVMPISGRMLGVGGHVHDYGEMLRLEDVSSGRVLFKLEARHDSVGRVLSVSRQLFGISGRGRKLEAGRRYRLVVTYDNPTGKVIPEGAMGEAGIGFTPDDPSQWPRLDVEDPDIARDLAHLATFESAVIPASR
jgi:hypothetical protein